MIASFLAKPTGRPRDFDPDHDIVLITGGARGLGLLVSSIYGMRGVSVAVLDVRKPNDEYPGVLFIECDVSDLSAVEKAKKQVEENFGGPVSVLINNAAILNGKRASDWSPADVKRALDVNLGGAYNALMTFLPGMRESKRGGVVVTIGSVLGTLPAAGTSLYAPMKAGLKALHTVLSAECKQDGDKVKCVMVELGQMKTEMFAGIKTPNRFLAAEMEAVEVAREIVGRIEDGRGGEYEMPLYARWAGLYWVLPLKLRHLARWASGIDRAMVGWKKQD